MPAPMTATRNGVSGGHVVLAPRRGPTVLAPVAQLLLEQRQVGGHVGAADGELHDAEHDVVVGHRSRPAAAVAEADQRGEGELPDGDGLVASEAGVGQEEQQRIGPQVVTEQREVAGGVGE